ncbi:hypothetical protein DFH06DRAFT_1396922 [Mycena polygramma]|nr:hypothetical protein DFH06DRAFT_1396922 [Mycena polygramma]
MRVLTTITYLTAAASTLAINVPPEIAGRGKTIFPTGASLTISLVEAPPPPTGTGSAIVSAYSKEVQVCNIYLQALQDALAEYNHSNNFDVPVTNYNDPGFLNSLVSNAVVQGEHVECDQAQVNVFSMEDVSTSPTPPAPSSSSITGSQATTSASISTSTQPTGAASSDTVSSSTTTGNGGSRVVSSGSSTPSSSPAPSNTGGAMHHVPGAVGFIAAIALLCL